MDGRQAGGFAAAGVGVGCVVIGAAFSIAAAILAGVFYFRQVPTSIEFRGAEPPPVKSRRAIPMRSAVVLDQFGRTMDVPVVWSVSPATVAVLSGDSILPLGDGVATVTADVQDLASTWSVSVDVPPDFSGWWRGEAMTQRGRAEVFVHAAPDGPDAYRTSMHYLTQVGGQRRSYGLLTKSSFTSDGVCEEHGLLVPADAPIDATRGCAAIVKEEPNALTFQSATNGTWTLHRAHASELETLLAEVPLNLDRMREAELDHVDRLGTFLEAGSEPIARKQLTSAPRHFASDSGFVRLSFEPTCCSLRSAYWIVTTPGGFAAHGIIDLDNDGEVAEWVATQASPATRITPPDVR